MARILALDSSTDACSVALHIDGETSHVFELAAKSHTQRLLPMVDEMLRASGCELRDLDAIAYGRGPGSFTGLRICMGVVQGLAFGANLPVIPVSTLHAMACGFVANNPNINVPLLVALDARMDEVYWSLFDTQISGQIPKPLVEEYVMSPAKLCEQVAVEQLEKHFVGLGPGWHYAVLQALAPERIISDVYPDAKDMMTLALEAFARNEQLSILDAQPVYLRDSVSWQKRQRIRTQPIANS